MLKCDKNYQINVVNFIKSGENYQINGFEF